MNLYHASKNEFESGRIIKGNSCSRFYPKATPVIDSAKPENAPSRRTALYCADSIDLSVYFLMKESVDLEDIRLYEVRVEDPHKAPFCITDVVNGRLEEGKNVDKLVQEYWHPVSDWYYFEYLTTEFEVITKLDVPVINTTILLHRYWQDRDRALAIG